jgi:hypothetical protein
LTIYHFGVMDEGTALRDESYLASFESIADTSIPESYFDEFSDDLADITTFVDAPTGPEKLAALDEVKDVLTSGPGASSKKAPMFPEFTARVKSAIEQTVELAADISNDVSKGGTNTIGMVTGAATRGRGQVKNFVGTNRTTQEIIKNLEQARGIVSDFSKLGTKTKIGIGIGTLGAIGAYSSADRKRR